MSVCVCVSVSVCVRKCTRRRERGTHSNFPRQPCSPTDQSIRTAEYENFVLSFGALVLFIKPTLSPPIPQRYGVIKVSCDLAPRRTVKQLPESFRPNLEGHVTKFAPNEALQLMAWCKLTFDVMLYICIYVDMYIYIYIFMYSYLYVYLCICIS